MHSHTPLTEAARRVVEMASMLAEQDGREYHSADLLRALWLDESRGHEMLTECGVVFSVLPQSTGKASAESSVSLSEIVRQANRWANTPGWRGDIGTEHLLLALIEHDAGMSDWGAERGVTLELLREKMPDAESQTAATIDTKIRLKEVEPAVVDVMLTDRLLDAAANRCREVLRVLEDVARFILNDAVVSEELKGLRHGLQQTFAKLAIEAILARDTIGDVGTAISLPTEMSRSSLMSLVRSNAARAQEALRSLEEVAKLKDAELAQRFEQLRYRTYTVEALLVRRFLIAGQLEQAKLYLLVTDSLCVQPIGKVVKEACAAGVDVVQLREKSMPDARLRELAGYIREWTAEAGVLFIVNDRLDIAALVGADGVHVGQDDLSIAEARRIVGGDKLVGVSTHNIAQLRQGVLEGADYLGVGPVFASSTKCFEELAGLEFVRQAAAETSLPWFGIGGINLANVESFRAAGGERIAVSSALCASDKVGEAARQLREALEAQHPNQPFASSSIRSAP